MARRAGVRDKLDDGKAYLGPPTPSTSSPTKGGAWKKASTLRSTTPPLTSTSASSSTSSSLVTGAASPSSSPTIAVKFAGKVYRTLDQQLNGVEYTSEANFLGEPDEEIGDIERERAEERRRRLEHTLLVEPLSSPKKKRTGSSLFHDSKRSRDRNHRSSSFTSSESSSPTKLSTPTKQLNRPLARSPSPPGAPFLARARPLTSSASAASLGQAISLDTQQSSPLPDALAELVALHAALEGALIMHLGTAGWAVASSAATEHHSDGSSTIRIPNLIDLSDLSKMLQSGARRFGQRELSRLVWAWQGCDLDQDEGSDSDDGLMVEHRREGEAGGLGFIVTRTRVGRGGKIENTYGVGISVTLKSNPQLPKFELLPPLSPTRRASPKSTATRTDTPPSPSSLGRGRDGMSVVALWTQGKNNRRTELVKRLRAWGRRCARIEQAQTSPIYDPQYPQFPFDMPEIPRATLPPLESAVASVPGTSSPSPRKAVAPRNDVFGPAVPIAGPSKAVLMLFEETSQKKAPSTAKAKASERNRLMRERLAAKHAETQVSPTNQAFLSSLAEAASPTKSLKRLKRGDADEAWTMEQEVYKRNAMISRLGNVADVVAMFSMKCGGRPSLVYDVAIAVSNSPLVKVGEDEAMESLHLLCDLFPDFSHIKAVDRQDWLYLRRDAKPTDVKTRVAEELELVRSRSKS